MVRTLRHRVSRSTLTLMVIVLLTTCGLPSWVQRTRAQRHDRHTIVSVLGKNDVPVAGLTAPNFIVKEDGATREVISVTPGSAPAHVVLLVDDSQASTPILSYLRDGLKAFADLVLKHASSPSLRLTTFGERPTVQVDFTTSAAALTHGIDRIVPRTGAGAMLLQAIVETCKDLRTQHIDGAAIVAFVAEGGPEFSNESRARVGDAVKAAGATLWAVTFRDSSPDTNSTEARERSMVLGDVTTESGGMNKTVLGPQGIAPAFLTTATALTSQYDVAYGRPDRLIPPTKLTVEVRDRTQKVLVRRWPAE